MAKRFSTALALFPFSSKSLLARRPSNWRAVFLWRANTTGADPSTRVSWSNSPSISSRQVASVVWRTRQEDAAQCIIRRMGEMKRGKTAANNWERFLGKIAKQRNYDCFKPW